MKRIAAALFLLMGCAYRTAPIVTAQPIELTHVRVVGEGATAVNAAEVRERMARMVKHANAHARGAPIQMSVAVELDQPVVYGGAIAALWIIPWPIFAGMVVEREKLAVDVVIVSSSRLLRGHAAADKQGSIYAPALKRSLAEALRNAIADAR